LSDLGSLAAAILVSIAAVGAACAPDGDDLDTGAPAGPAFDRVAEAYVKLVLALGRHDPDYVDAYHGPERWREEVLAARPSLSEIHDRALAFVRELEADRRRTIDAESASRRDHLAAQLRALVARAEILSGKRMSFDLESKALYDASAQRYPDRHFEALREELEPLVPGDGPLGERYERFRARFAIPPDRLDAVFRRAIEECRERTADHIDLPPGERFEIEYVRGKPWSGYNWYQGGYESLIQVNTDLPITIDRAIDLACHEGYPGHHVYNTLLERHLLRDRGWVEYSIYPLFSPQSLIAEGTANFGIEVAFPGNERIEFERETLFPLAGLDPAAADRYYEVQKKVEGLAWAGNEAARRYLDGEIDRAGAIDYLMRYALMPRLRAEQRADFIDRYRSYVINYNLGQEIVRGWVERNGGTPDNPERRWELFRELLSSPRLPSALVD
jgi:hypothetical protein